MHEFTKGEEVLSLTIIVKGASGEYRFSPADLVSSVIFDVLPDHLKPDAVKFEIRDTSQGSKVLVPNQTLHENGVKDRDVLSVVKIHGGGG
jgi:hypothetical protein